MYSLQQEYEHPGVQIENINKSTVFNFQDTSPLYYGVSTKNSDSSNLHFCAEKLPPPLYISLEIVITVWMKYLENYDVWKQSKEKNDLDNILWNSKYKKILKDSEIVVKSYMNKILISIENITMYQANYKNHHMINLLIIKIQSIMIWLQALISNKSICCDTH